MTDKELYQLLNDLSDNRTAIAITELPNPQIRLSGRSPHPAIIEKIRTNRQSIIEYLSQSAEIMQSETEAYIAESTEFIQLPKNSGGSSIWIGQAEFIQATPGVVAWFWAVADALGPSQAIETIQNTTETIQVAPRANISDPRALGCQPIPVAAASWLADQKPATIGQVRNLASVRDMLPSRYYPHEIAKQFELYNRYGQNCKKSASGLIASTPFGNSTPIPDFAQWIKVKDFEKTESDYEKIKQYNAEMMNQQFDELADSFNIPFEIVKAAFAKHGWEGLNELYWLSRKRGFKEAGSIDRVDERLARYLDVDLSFVMDKWAKQNAPGRQAPKKRAKATGKDSFVGDLIADIKNRNPALGAQGNEVGPPPLGAGISQGEIW